MSDLDEDLDRPRKKGKKKKRLSNEARAKSYAVGIMLFLFGVGMLVWYYYTERAPGKLFKLLAAGSVACVLSAVGLFIQPLVEDRLDAFQNDPNPIAVFGVMPPFWKAWLVLILAAMIGAFIYVAQTTERVR